MPVVEAQALFLWVGTSRSYPREQYVAAGLVFSLLVQSYRFEGVSVSLRSPREGSGEELGERQPPRRQCEASDRRERRRGDFPRCQVGRSHRGLPRRQARGRTRGSPGAVRGVATDAAAKRGSPPPSETRRVAG